MSQNTMGVLFQCSTIYTAKVLYIVSLLFYWVPLHLKVFIQYKSVIIIISHNTGTRVWSIYWRWGENKEEGILLKESRTTWVEKMFIFFLISFKGLCFKVSNLISKLILIWTFTVDVMNSQSFFIVIVLQWSSVKGIRTFLNKISTIMHQIEHHATER